MRERIENILLDVRADIDFNEEKYLVSDGIFESIDIITLITELEDEFEVSIGTELIVADNFDSIDAIVELIEKLQTVWVRNIFKGVEIWHHATYLVLMS